MALTKEQQTQLSADYRCMKEAGVPHPLRPPGRQTLKDFLQAYVNAAQNPPQGTSYSQDCLDAAASMSTLADALD